MAVSKSNLSAITKQNLDKTIRTYKRAILGGDIHLTSKLFELYARNGMAVEMALLSQATYELARFMVRNNLERGMALFEYASNPCGHFESMLILFNHYALNHLQKDNPKFLKLRDNMYKLAERYQAEAEANTDPAMVFQLYDKAIELYDRVRKLGSTDAIYKLAQCYEKSSMPQYDTALELYEWAAGLDHLGALYRLCEIYAENIEYISSLSCTTLANKLYESAQFYQHLQGLENKEHTQKLYELAARFHHIKAEERVFSFKLENKLSFPLANMKQENPLNKVDVWTAESKSVNFKPVSIENKTSKGKENHFSNHAIAIDKLGVFSNAKKPGGILPHIPSHIGICQPGY